MTLVATAMNEKTVKLSQSIEHYFLESFFDAESEKEIV
jgi:hypothetical protein